MLHSPALQPFAQVAIDHDQMIIGAAGDPEQMQLRIGLGVSRRKILLKILGNAAGTESTDPGEFIEVVQAGEERF